MGTLSLPQMSSAGTITLTQDSRAVTGDSTTLSNVTTAGVDLVVVGSQGVWTVQTAAVDDGGGDGDFTILELWTAATDTAAAYVFAEPLDPDVRNIIAVADAIGAFSGRSSHNAESAGYLYLSVDGAGSDTLPILFERVTSTSGVWAAVDDIEDVDTVDEGGNPVLNAQGFVTDPYIEDAAKDDTDALIRTPWYVLCQANDVTEDDSTSDVTFNRGIKLTKTTAAGRMGIAQIILNSDRPDVFGVLNTMAAKARLSAGGNLRFALLSDTGTDETPKDLVNDWTSTTYDASGSNFFVSTVTVEAVGVLTLAAAEALSFDLATDAEVVKTQGRLIAFVWTEASQSTSATLELTDFQIVPGGGRPKVLKPPPVETAKLPLRLSVPATGFLGRNKIINPNGRPLANNNLFGTVNASDGTMGPYFPWYVLTSTGTALTQYGFDLSDPAMPVFFGLRADTTQKIALAQKIGVPPLTATTLSDVIDMFGRPLVLSFIAQANVNMDIRYAVIRVAKSASTVWNYDIVNNWASTSYTSGGFFVTSTVDFVGATSLVANEAQEIVGFVPPLTGTNSEIYFIVWTEDDVAVNNTLHLRSVQLEVGQEKTPFAQEFLSDEQLRSTLVKPINLAFGSLSGSSVDIVEDQPGLWATYRELHLTISGASINLGTAQTLSVLLSNNSGSSFATSNYAGCRVTSAGAGAVVTSHLTIAGFASASHTNEINLVLQGHQGGTFPISTWNTLRSDSTASYGCSSYIGSTSATNAIRLILSSGSFDAGTYTLVGIR